MVALVQLLVTISLLLIQLLVSLVCIKLYFTQFSHRLVLLSCLCVCLVDTPGLLTIALQQVLDDPTFKAKTPTAVDARRAAVHMLQ